MNKQSLSPVMLQLSAYIAHAARRPLPAPVVEKTKHHVLDTTAFTWRVLQRHNRQTVCWKGTGRVPNRCPGIEWGPPTGAPKGVSLPTRMVPTLAVCELCSQPSFLSPLKLGSFHHQ